MPLHLLLPKALLPQSENGRAGGIRTRGLFVPNEALYQAEPQPVIFPRRGGYYAAVRPEGKRIYCRAGAIAPSSRHPRLAWRR